MILQVLLNQTRCLKSFIVAQNRMVYLQKEKKMSPAPASQSIAELITEFYKTTGDVPPLLIGATTTLVGGYLYLFGGRVPRSKRISNSVYRLNLPTKEWELLNPQYTPPTPRYFHSADHYENYIIFYGGMTIKKDAPDQLITLNDLVFFDIETLSWEYPKLKEIPSPRYAHVSTLSAHRLIIMGGQTLENQYLKDIHIFDCKRRKWCKPIMTDTEFGAYRSAAVAVTPIQLTPLFAPTIDPLSESLDEPNMSPKDDTSITIHVYSNYPASQDSPNLFTSWKLNSRNELMSMDDLTEQCSKHFPVPSLRFPVSFMCGQQFIVAGPHLSNAVQQFHIWALDVNNFVWTKIEAGPTLNKGAWLHSALCQMSNRFIVFGNPDRLLKEDYRDRIHSFECMACVDIEVLGIYRPPAPSYSASGQHLGLKLLNDPMLSDLKIITTDNQSMLVNSVVLSQRWPSIRHLLEPLLNPELGSVDILDHGRRELSFPDTHEVLVAFLQFIYTDHLFTAQQHQPHILARLLLIANLFDIPRLKELATHTLHQMLNMSTASMIYESASLSNAVSLQIRALRVLIKVRKMRQMQNQAERPFSPPMLSTESTQHHRALLDTPPSSQEYHPQPQQKYSSLQQKQHLQSKLLQKPEPRYLPALSDNQPMNGSFGSLQKSDSIRHNNHNNNNTPISSFSSQANFQSSATAATAPLHNRSPSQRSLSNDSTSPTTPSTPSATKGMKIPSFFSRQPLIAEESPTPVASKSQKSHFWRNNGSNLSKKKSSTEYAANKPSRSDSTRAGTFHFMSTSS
ncbi:galactose oxidase [Backusella circina FSU 941]|nr:galactose oxidase [Backusella circina FSU 941]